MYPCINIHLPYTTTLFPVKKAWQQRRRVVLACASFSKSAATDSVLISGCIYLSCILCQHTRTILRDNLQILAKWMYMMYVYIYIIHFIHTVVQYGAVIQNEENEAAVKAKRARLDIITRGISLWIPWWTHSICILAHAVRCMPYCETNPCWRNGHNVCMSKIRWCLRYQQDDATT